jgi:hypothetical protein
MFRVPPEGFEPSHAWLVPLTGFEPVHGYEPGGDPKRHPPREASQVIADERALVREAARKLGFDPDDRGSLADLAAVGIARLAWRDGLVEDWHAVPQRRISDSEMMRASAAVTRAVRDLLATELPPSPWPRDPSGGGAVMTGSSRTSLTSCRRHRGACRTAERSRILRRLGRI